MNKSAVRVAGIGMITAVGLNAQQCAASVRAGISRYAESPIQNGAARPITMALLPDAVLPELKPEASQLLSRPTARQTRMLRLADSACREALAEFAGPAPPPLFLATPEGMPSQPSPLDGSFLNALYVQVDGLFDVAQSLCFPHGRAGGFEALAAATQALASGQHNYALIGGVDSYLDLALLAALDAETRLLADGVMDGFAPGEGAAFVLLCAREALPSAVAISAPGIAVEAGHRYSEQPYKGDGLADAVRAALTAFGGSQVRSVICSLNGENFGAKEWGVALTRNGNGIDAEAQLEHPAEFLGDTGAATGPLIIGLSVLGLTAGYLNGPSLVWCSSDGPLRGAAVVAAPSNQD